MTQHENLMPLARAERAILFIRGQRVMLDADLAQIYGIKTMRLNEQVKRNRDRFPEDFMFQLTTEEVKNVLCLRSQFAISKKGRGGRRYLPYVFTEHGAVMLASVLNSPTAIQASVYVVRAFVRLREILATHKELAHKLNELENRLDGHDADIRDIIAAIRGLMTVEKKPRGGIGYRTPLCWPEIMTASLALTSAW